MPAITPEFMFDLESNMRLVSTRSYEKLNANSWWEKVAKRMSTSSKKERINWLLDTAKIERPNAKNGGGQQIFEDIVSETTEFTVENAVAALKLKKEQLEDLDGNGVQLATHWSRQIGAYAAYWPQREVAAMIDRCPHRFAPLSTGTRDGDMVTCPYHGLTFDTNGICVRNPFAENPPKGAQLRTFPTAERDGNGWRSSLLPPLPRAPPRADLRGPGRRSTSGPGLRPWRAPAGHRVRSCPLRPTCRRPCRGG